jgi:serralysin
MPSHLAGRRTVRAASALTLALGAGLVAPFLLAGTADAATPSATAAFSSSEHAIVYSAAAGQADNVTVTASMTDAPGEIAYAIDDTVPISAGDGCTYPSSTDHTKVLCTVATLESQDPYAALEMSLGDGNDVVGYDNTTDQAYYFASIDLGAGDDTLTESSSVEGNNIHGGAGDDNLTAGPYSVVSGDDDNDTIQAGEGSIAFGDGGSDTIYSVGEDSSVDGGAGDDVIQGGADRQDLSGGDGNDTIRGGAGDDFVYGGTGDDTLYGNRGDDTIYGNSGNDKLYGGLGTDTLSGGPGTNVVQQD